MSVESNIGRREDTVEKAPVSHNDIAFLQSLQREMNTQDTLCQADPRFWVIKGSEKVYPEYDGYSLMLDDNEVACSFEDAASYISGKSFNEDTGLKATAKYERDLFFDGVLTVRCEEMPGWEELVFYSMEELVSWLNDYVGYERYSFAGYVLLDRIYPDTFFLTQKEAQNHLKKNYYHYSEDAHTYAMTAWRAPDVEQLYGILEKTDFQDLKRRSAYKELLERIVENLLIAGKPSEVLRYLLYLGFEKETLVDLNFDEEDIDKEEASMAHLTDFSCICPIF